MNLDLFFLRKRELVIFVNYLDVVWPIMSAKLILLVDIQILSI